MRKIFGSQLSNESGSALLLALMVLVVLSALAVVTIRISTTNLDTAANEKFHEMNFFKTDADSELVAEIIEQNIQERGFTIDPLDPGYGNNGDIGIYNPTFFNNGKALSCPSETNRDVQVDYDVDPETRNTTYVTVGGDRQFNPGSAIQLPEGYHGRGKGSASGGVQIIYSIRNFGRGLGNSQTRVTMRWRHVT
jgi:cell division protein FtsL